MDSPRRGWRVDGEARPRQGRRCDARIRRRALLGTHGSRKAARARRRGARRSGARRRRQGVVPRPVGPSGRTRLSPGWRFAAGATAALVGQQVLVALALKRRTERDGSRHRLTLVDGFTLSRGATGALMIGLIASGVRHRRGSAGWLGWIALLYGAVLRDLLDRSLPRRPRATRGG